MVQRVAIDIVELDRMRGAAVDERRRAHARIFAARKNHGIAGIEIVTQGLQ